MKWLLFAALLAGLVSAETLNAALMPLGDLLPQEQDEDRDGVISDEREERDQKDERDEREEEEEPDANLVPAFPSNIAKVGLKKGDLIPEIEGKDFEGVKFKLSDYKGKVIMLDFWGDW